MWDLVWDSIADAFMDSIKLIIFLFAAYLVMEWIERRTEHKQAEKISKAGKVGPLAGGLMGVVPQCGFSVAAANLYTGGVISIGTLLAVFMSTSDEMLPIFISEKVAAGTIIKILAVKALIAILTGFLIDMVIRLSGYKDKHKKDIHEICEEEHCHCEDGILKSAALHTIKITLFIFVISVVLNIVIGVVGEDTLKTVFSDVPVIAEVISALVGLIPNCSASVLITELYLEGVLNAGAMMAGLLVSAGVGVMVLFRMNRHHMKENLKVLALLYLTGLAWGIIIDAAGIVF